jgi:glycosyltransferase 2 family protein
LKRILQIAAIVALTVFFLWLFLRNANLREVGQILRGTNLVWIFIGFAVNATALVLRTVRWQTLLDPESPPPFYATFFANTVGYMLSTILPIRAADVARPALLARRTSLRFSGALGTVLTERILDLTSILGLFVYFAFRRWNEFSHDPAVAAWFYIVRGGAIASVAILAALGFLFIGLTFFRPNVRALHDRLGLLLPERFRSSWMHFFDAFTDSLEIAKNRPLFFKVVLCTAGVWACLTSQFWFATKAVEHPLPFDASFFVTGVTTVGLAIPTPGGIGGFHKACQLVLTRFYAFDVDSSVAVAVLFHIIGTLPVLVMGLALFLREGLRWKDVTSKDAASEG